RRTSSTERFPCRRRGREHSLASRRATRSRIGSPGARETTRLAQSSTVSRRLPLVAETDRGAPTRVFLARLELGILAALCVIAAEFCVLSLLHRSRFASVWEFQFGLAGILPSALVCATLAGTVGALSWWLVESVRAASARTAVARRALAALVFCFGASVAFAVGGGRHLEALEVRLGFAAAV